MESILGSSPQHTDFSILNALVLAGFANWLGLRAAAVGLPSVLVWLALSSNRSAAVPDVQDEDDEVRQVLEGGVD